MRAHLFISFCNFCLISVTVTCTALTTMHSGYAILAVCALMAAVGVRAAPADLAPAQQFAGLPFAPSKFSPEGFPLNENGDEFHLIQKGADDAPTWIHESQVWDLKKDEQEFMDVT